MRNRSLSSSSSGSSSEEDDERMSQLRSIVALATGDNSATAAAGRPARDRSTNIPPYRSSTSSSASSDAFAVQQARARRLLDEHCALSLLITDDVWAPSLVNDQYLPARGMTDSSY